MLATYNANCLSVCRSVDLFLDLYLYTSIHIYVVHLFLTPPILIYIDRLAA